MIQITTDQYQSYQLYPEFLKSYLIKNNLLDSRQSGFRSLRSTVIPILDLTNRRCFNIDRGLVSEFYS